MICACIAILSVWLKKPSDRLHFCPAYCKFLLVKNVNLMTGTTSDEVLTKRAAGGGKRRGARHESIPERNAVSIGINGSFPLSMIKRLVNFLKVISNLGGNAGQISSLDSDKGRDFYFRRRSDDVRHENIEGTL